MSTTLTDMHRRRFVRTIGGCAIAAAVPLSGCSSLAAGIPDSANAAWSPDAHSDDPRIQALSWAILAPNPHNRQPWLMELIGTDEIVVHIDKTRLLPDTDPFGRQILIGTGAMLGLLDIAAAEFGYRTETTWFEKGEFANAIDDRPVARVRLIKKTTIAAEPLFQHITNRRTVRGAYDGDRMPGVDIESDLAALSAGSALSAGVVSRAESPEHSADISSLAKRAFSIELLNPETFMESMRLLRIGSREIEKHRDGINITSPFLVVLARVGLFDRTKSPAPDSSIMKRQIGDFEAVVDSTPAFFVLTSEDNTRVTQLKVGKAYIRAQLLATARDLVMHPLSQALQEYPEMSEAYRDAHRLLLPVDANGAATVQMLCRIGYLPAGESLPVASPRRGLDAHLAV